MEELSIEEKAKAYDEALERARLYKGLQAEMSVVFPELAESEDKRMIKSINRLISHYYDVNFPTPEGFTREELVSWLEKQGEHANFRNKIQIGDKVTRNEDGVLVNLSQLNRVAKKDEKQGEQKPVNLVTILDDYFANTPKEQQDKDWEELKHLNNFREFVVQKPAEVRTTGYWNVQDIEQKPTEWSGEDEQYLEDTLNLLEGHRSKNTYGDVVEWLKSLRLQSHWKPSGEQMEALEYFVRSIGESGYASPYDNNTKLLYSLLSDLMKLREE